MNTAEVRIEYRTHQVGVRKSAQTSEVPRGICSRCADAFRAAKVGTPQTLTVVDFGPGRDNKVVTCKHLIPTVIQQRAELLAGDMEGQS